MAVKYFRGTTISSVYHMMLRQVYEGHDRTPRGLHTKEIRPVVLELSESYKNKFIFFPGRKFNYAFAIAEIFWILGGRGDYEFIGHYNSDIKKFLDDPEGDMDMIGLTTEHRFNGAYGFRMRKMRGIDQLDMVALRLMRDKDSRQGVVILWDSLVDNMTVSRDYPCNTQVMFKMGKGGLDISVIRRSNDVIWGLPYNIIQFTALQEYMASNLEVAVGNYVEFIDSLHVYTTLYPELYDFFGERLHKDSMGAISLPEYHMPMNPKFVVLDKFIHDFFNVEKQWRIWAVKEGQKQPYQERMKQVYSWLDWGAYHSPNTYWGDLYKFLLMYHLYKAGFYMETKAVVYRMSPMFKYMAVETCRKISGDLVHSLNCANISAADLGVLHKTYTKKEVTS